MYDFVIIETCEYKWIYIGVCKNSFDSNETTLSNILR